MQFTQDVHSLLQKIRLFEIMANMNRASDWPNNWIKRTFEDVLKAPYELAPHKVLLLLGPRQVGKSSLLQHCALEGMSVISLDDLGVRMRANEDPVLFSKELRIPTIIDEIQYAPKLLSTVKQLVDNAPVKNPVVWMTGSQNFEVMSGVRESLAGRVVIVQLLGLSDEEKGLKTSITSDAYFDELCAGTFPALAGISRQEQRDRYFSSYIQTYIERDIRELLGIQKRREFEVFLKLCALRTGQLINFEDLGRDAGVSGATAKEWISLLEDSFVIKIVHPYYTSQSKRLIKTPKLYFLDAGLAAFLAGWSGGERARLGPMGGALFETHIFGQIIRAFSHRARASEVYFLRTKEQVEIDFIVKTNDGYLPIEVKLGRVASSDLLNTERLVSFGLRESGLLITLVGESQPRKISDSWTMIHPNDLSFVSHLLGVPAPSL